TNEEGDTTDIKFDISTDTLNFKETLTELKYDPDTRELLYRDEDSVVNPIPLDSLDFKNITTYLKDNGDRTFTYINEKRDSITINFGGETDTLQETTTILKYNKQDHYITYQDENKEIDTWRLGTGRID